MRIMRILIALVALLGLNSCATNPATGDKIFLLTSESQENRMGEQAYRELQGKEKEVDQHLAKRVEIIGQRLAAVAGRPDYKWEFRTFQNDTPNAFCLPGGKVGVYSGILKYAKNDAGLAAVLGHEIGHALARHGGQRMSQQISTQLIVAGAAAVGFTKMNSTERQLAIAALGAGLTIGVILPFSRSHETEADEIGLRLMALAGYDPSEAVNFWDRFSKAGGANPPKFLSTHPSSEDRRDHLQELLPDAERLYTSIPRQHGKGLDF